MIVNILMCIIESAHDFKNILNKNTLKTKTTLKTSRVLLSISVLDKPL